MDANKNSVSGFDRLLATENPTHKRWFRSAKTDRKPTEKHLSVLD